MDAHIKAFFQFKLPITQIKKIKENQSFTNLKTKKPQNSCDEMGISQHFDSEYDIS